MQRNFAPDAEVVYADDMIDFQKKRKLTKV
jgi:hypothetical protein